MSVLNSIDMQRRPTHPGEMLREDFLPDYHLSVSALAKALGVSRRSMSELCRERRAVSPEIALRLARLFGNSAAFWINAQRAVDLWDAAQTIKEMKLPKSNPFTHNTALYPPFHTQGTDYGFLVSAVICPHFCPRLLKITGYLFIV